MNILALIPARGGSKGIPRKNLAQLCGRPLITWTIAAARSASCITRIVVSTDDGEVSRVARENGAEAPFLRPAELATDTTPGIEPVIHAVEWLDANERYQPDLVMLLQPTSPLRTSADIQASVELFNKSGADAVVSVTEAEHHPYWMKRFGPGGRLEDFVRLGEVPARRQDLPPAYALNGAIYLIKREVLLSGRTLFPADTAGYVMPRERSLDIDSLLDLRVAGLLLQDGVGQ